MSYDVLLWALGIAVAGTLALILGGNLIAATLTIWELRGVVRAGRVVRWREAVERCRNREGLLVLASRRWPREVWFVEAPNDEQRGANLANFREVGRLVTEVPAALDRAVIDGEKIAECWLDYSGGSLGSIASRSAQS